MSLLKFSGRLSTLKKLSISCTNSSGRYFTSDEGTKQTNLYEVLGLRSSATAVEIKKAYYDLTFKFHPDRNKGSTNAANKFREVTEAYGILSDYSLRKRYDKGLPLPIDEARKEPHPRNIVEPMVTHQAFFDSRSYQYEQPRSGFSFKEYDFHDEHQMDGKRIPPGLEGAAEEFERSQKQQWVVLTYLIIVFLIIQYLKKEYGPAFRRVY